MSFSTWFKTAAKSKPTVIDPLGQQVADLFCFDASNPRDALSAGRSIDYNDTLFLTTGHILYSQQSKPMLQILDDTCGRRWKNQSRGPFVKARGFNFIPGKNGSCGRSDSVFRRSYKSWTLQAYQLQSLEIEKPLHQRPFLQLLKLSKHSYR